MTPRKEHRKTYVCDCLKVTEADVVKAICAHEISDVDDIIRYTQAGDGCTSCHPALRELCERAAISSLPRPSARQDNSQGQPALLD